MLETQRRLSAGIPGCPQTKQSTARAFFEKLEKDLEGKKVPVWSGELYLEYHRATYTSMAKNKKNNRKGEFALNNLEDSALLARELCGIAYPAEEKMQEYWEILLRNQFHDILPGSSIAEVYEDSDREYQSLFAFTETERVSRMRAIADLVGKPLAFNHNGQKMSGFVTMSNPGNLTCVQRTADGDYLVWAEDVPSKGYTVVENKWTECGAVQISTVRVETPFAEILLNEKGHITSWYDKAAGRQILKNGQCANVLMTYEDKPHKYDNWNLFEYYKEKAWPVEELITAEVIENGPYRYALMLQWQYQDTKIEEVLYFYGNSPRVDVRFTTDWKEDQIFMKVLFPLEMNTTEATFEIQYGNVKRPTVCNTSWDLARFEVCYHKWMDVSEGGYGVSFLNDCKYGVSVEENTVGLSLIKSGNYPNPKADREYHRAVYSILPHMGTWKEAGMVKEAYLLNNPLQVVTGKSGEAVLPETYSLASHDERNVMIEVVKKAEDTTDTIVRLYEFENQRTSVKVKFARKAKRIWLCNMMEEKKQLLAEESIECDIMIKPFEIITLSVEYENNGNW